MDFKPSKTKVIGVLFILGIIIGIFTIAPAIDSNNYLYEAAANSNQVIRGAVFQFILSLIYLIVGVLLYPTLKITNQNLSNTFLSLRVITTAFIILSTLIMLSILSLSHSYTVNQSFFSILHEPLGHLLKIIRDYINHVFMIISLCLSNILLYFILSKGKAIPNWLSISGILSSVLSLFASILILFNLMDIITIEYLLLNAPTAIVELFFGFWLIFKGFYK